MRGDRDLHPGDECVDRRHHHVHPLVPGPGFVVIPIGLAILAIEFEWARRALKRVKVMAATMQARIRDTVGGKEADGSPSGGTRSILNCRRRIET